MKEWEKFKQGEFWQRYEEFFEKERRINVEHLADATKANFDDLKVLQGINEGFKRIKNLPDKLVRELEKEVIIKQEKKG